MPTTARKAETDRENKIIGELLEVLTRPDSTITTADIFHYELLVQTMQTADVLDAHLATFKFHPQVGRGACVGLLVHLLHRLLSDPEAPGTPAG